MSVIGSEGWNGNMRGELDVFAMSESSTHVLELEDRVKVHLQVDHRVHILVVGSRGRERSQFQSKGVDFRGGFDADESMKMFTCVHEMNEGW